MSSWVLDASAVLVFFHQEPGIEQVARAIADGALISAVNLSEVVAKLSEKGLQEEEISESISLFSAKVETVDFDAHLAFEAGLLRLSTKRAGLSFGDRACLALAKRLKLPAMTADRAWENVPEEVGVQIIKITR